MRHAARPERDDRCADDADADPVEQFVGPTDYRRTDGEDGKAGEGGERSRPQAGLQPFRRGDHDESEDRPEDDQPPALEAGDRETVLEGSPSWVPCQRIQWRRWRTYSSTVDLRRTFLHPLHHHVTKASRSASKVSNPAPVKVMLPTPRERSLSLLELSERALYQALRADDGIRTRDPHLGKAMVFVRLVSPGPLSRFGSFGSSAQSVASAPPRPT